MHKYGQRVQNGNKHGWSAGAYRFDGTKIGNTTRRSSHKRKRFGEVGRDLAGTSSQASRHVLLVFEEKRQKPDDNDSLKLVQLNTEAKSASNKFQSEHCRLFRQRCGEICWTRGLGVMSRLVR